MANFNGEVPTIPRVSHGQPISSHIDSITVPLKTQATITKKIAAAFPSNALDYSMRGFHTVLGALVHWKAPFNDVNATQFVGAAGPITNVVVLARK